jgi:hypothetical protein
MYLGRFLLNEVPLPIVILWGDTVRLTLGLKPIKQSAAIYALVTKIPGSRNKYGAHVARNATAACSSIPGDLRESQPDQVTRTIKLVLSEPSVRYEHPYFYVGLRKTQVYNNFFETDYSAPGQSLKVLEDRLEIYVGQVYN